MVLSWGGITAVIENATSWGWPVYVVSASLYAALFEVGLAFFVSAAWFSCRQLEVEGAASASHDWTVSEEEAPSS